MTVRDKMKIPYDVDGTDVVCRIDDPVSIRGYTWYTLEPADDSDERLWEWCPDTGRIIRTR